VSGPPEVLAPPDAAPHCETTHVGCITCGDEALPMRVRRVDAGRGLALCEGEDGRRSTVEIALVEPVAAGDVLLVHAGTAIASADGVGCGGEPSGSGDEPSGSGDERSEADEADETE
jgi:hydrogenase maturation factor